MEERELTDTEVRSGTAAAQYSNTGDGDATSLDGGGDPPEEEQIAGAHESDSSGNDRHEEEGQTSPSVYMEILTEPAIHTEDISVIVWGAEELTDEVSPCDTSPVPKSSEHDASPDSGLTGESEDDRGLEDGEVTDHSASSDAHSAVGQLSHPSCPTDRSAEEGVTVPQDDCNTEAVRRLCLDLLVVNGSDVNNTTKSLTPDFSDHEVFFDLVWEMQSRRLNDQRCSFRKKIKDRRAYRSMPSSPLDKEKPFFPSMSSLQTEEFFDLIAYSQSHRLNDQRADFEESPTVELRSPFPEETVEYLAPVGRMVSQTQGGGAPAGAESPATERGQSPTERNVAPAEEEEVPAEGEEIPAEKEEAPAEKEQNPGEEIPAEKGEAPAEKEQNPGEEIPAEKGEAPAEKEQNPGEGEEIPAEKEQNPVDRHEVPAEKKEPDDELYNTILTHQSASARIEDQRSHPPAYSSQDFFDLLQRMQERRMDEQRAALPPGLAPNQAAERVQEERRVSIFSPLLKGMSQRRANSN
ncbi:otolith matrix protein OMM-64-like [Heterodontus francisci]|uniref:otolith matrix protein OMM-64-like n=1 Tax=Heterodontus francisci TaxID=7792 RepID=UPI00355C9CE0